jgi:hypothetical protein
MNQYIVIQGPTTYCKDIVKCYGEYSNVIFSTLNEESTDDVNFLQTKFDVVVSPYNFQNGYGNLNKQTITSCNGLKLAKQMGASHALKIRSDMTISNINSFMNILGNKSKLAFLAWHFHGYLVDYLNYGPIDEMIKFWDLVEINNTFAEKNLIQNYAKHINVSNITFENIKTHVDFFIEDLKTHNIRIHWMKYGLNISDYYKNESYTY